MSQWQLSLRPQNGITVSLMVFLKFQVEVDFTPAYDEANSWHILKTLQGSCLKVCKVLGESIQISETLELVTKIMFGCHINNKSADFYQDFSENQQFYLEHAKLSIFLLFCLYTQNVIIK